MCYFVACLYDDTRTQSIIRYTIDKFATYSKSKANPNPSEPQTHTHYTNNFTIIINMLYVLFRHIAAV